MHLYYRILATIFTIIVPVQLQAMDKATGQDAKMGFSINEMMLGAATGLVLGTVGGVATYGMLTNSEKTDEEKKEWEVDKHYRPGVLKHLGLAVPAAWCASVISTPLAVLDIWFVVIKGWVLVCP